MNAIFRTGSPFWPWVVATTLGFACFEALNPAIWFSADVLGLARVVAALGDAAAGGLLGAVIGAVIGAIAALAGAKKAPADPKRARAAASRFSTRMVLGGLVVGIAAGALDLAITPERASFVACTAIQKDYDTALQALKDNQPQKTIALATAALRLQKGCNGSAGGKMFGGSLYALRGAAYFQTDLLPARSNAEFERAAGLIKNCAADYPPGSGDRGVMCQTYTVAIERYRTQHYCDDALALANRAENAVYHDPSAAKALALQGVSAAGKCKNVFSYAYRGIALAQEAEAQAALGEPPAATIRASQPLLARCTRELAGGIASSCRNAQKLLVAARGGHP